jgi:hypothetical protein
MTTASRETRQKEEAEMADTNQQNQQQQNQQGQNQQNQQAQNQQGQNQQNQQQAAQKTWDEVLKGMPEDVQKLYNDHTSGLQNTIRATRDERDTARHELAEAAKKAEKGSELEKSLNDALAKLDAAEKRATFAEQAIQPENGCNNVKAAFALAVVDDLFKKNGEPDWEAIKKAAPQLFGALVPDGNGGEGTNNDSKPADMNARIRAAAAK